METPISQQVSALIEEITEAFLYVSRGNGIMLSEAWVIDAYGSDEERAAAKAQDTDTHWQEVPEDDISFGYLCLSYLDPVSFRYYLPAYMIWTLKNYGHTDSTTPEAIFSNLKLTDQNFHQWAVDLKQRLGLLPPPEYSKINKRELERFNIFSLEQSKSIAHFLQFFAECHTDEIAQKALDSSWQKFI